MQTNSPGSIRIEVSSTALCAFWPLPKMIETRSISTSPVSTEWLGAARGPWRPATLLKGIEITLFSMRQLPSGSTNAVLFRSRAPHASHSAEATSKARPSAEPATP